MKRFTETSKWSDPWFRRLAPAQKCLWLYLVDQCDPAGVLDPDWEMISFQIGAPVSLEDMAAFDGRVQILESGKLWLTKFIAFQYGELSATCKPHSRVFAALASHGLNPPLMKSRESIGQKSIMTEEEKGYAKGMDTLEEEEENKEENKEEEEYSQRVSPPLPLSWSKQTGWQGVGPLREQLRKAYPGRDLDLEFTAMDAWLRCHPPKKNFLSFVRNWLSRSKPSLSPPESDGDVRTEAEKKEGGRFRVLAPEPAGWRGAYEAAYGRPADESWADLPPAAQRDIQGALAAATDLERQAWAKNERGAA